jgi:hypothetical protein
LDAVAFGLPLNDLVAAERSEAALEKPLGLQYLVHQSS